MRPCPVCTMWDRFERTYIFSMEYKIPDGWPLPARIEWYTCDCCGVLYGDEDFDQKSLNAYYAEFYGYGVNSDENIARLIDNAAQMARTYPQDARIVDFGGAGDDGKSVLVSWLHGKDFERAECVGVTDSLPNNCDVIFASHVLEHIYDLPDTMRLLVSALAPGGTLIMDGPDAAHIPSEWPIMDFNTKHLNHFTLLDYLRLGKEHGLEMVRMDKYQLGGWPCYQIHFQRSSVAETSHNHIRANVEKRLEKLRAIEGPVNVWGLSDVTWHLLAQVDLDVQSYVDNDPAYRGRTYAGKPVKEVPENMHPILILAQGQRQRLIGNIRKKGITNEIVEI